MWFKTNKKMDKTFIPKFLLKGQLNEINIKWWSSIYFNNAIYQRLDPSVEFPLVDFCTFYCVLWSLSAGSGASIENIDNLKINLKFIFFSKKILTEIKTRNPNPMPFWTIKDFLHKITNRKSAHLVVLLISYKILLFISGKNKINKPLSIPTWNKGYCLLFSD